MFDRILLPALLAASGALACAASTKCIPDAYARQFTLVKGDADALLVQEYAVSGCMEIVVDSIVRRAVPVDSISPSIDNRAKVASNAAKPSSAVTVHWKYSTVKLDSTTAAACARLRTIRRVDSIPRASEFSWTTGTDYTVESVVPPNPDSVFACNGSSCSKVGTRSTEEPGEGLGCLDGLVAPLQSTQEALDFLKERIASARAIYVLNAQHDIIIGRMCDIITVYDNVAARAASLAPFVQKESRLAADPWNILELPRLRDWSDPAIPRSLAIPSSANAGDYFAPETLSFLMKPLFGDGASEQFRYATGVKLYRYQGTNRPYPTSCPTEDPTPVYVGDSLRLEGLSVRISTPRDCALPGVDVFAGQYDSWLFAPDGSASRAEQFQHGSSAETRYSWPIVDDAIVVRGQRVPLAMLKSVVQATPRQPLLAPFAARIADGSLSVTLDQSATVRLSAPDGRILSSSPQPAGTSRVAFPHGYHGILLVDAGSHAVRMLVP